MLGARLLDRRIDLRAGQQGDAAPVESQHQQDQAAERAVRRVVIVSTEEASGIKSHGRPRTQAEVTRTRRVHGPR
jgi:hypothetical protein